MNDEPADIAKRIVATGVDLVIATVIFWVLDSVAVRLIAALVAAGFLLLRDSLNFDRLGGVSPGKVLLGLRAVTGKHSFCDHVSSVKRNLTVAAPFLALACLSLLLFFPDGLVKVSAAVVGALALAMELSKLLSDPEGLRVGDLLAGTRVIAQSPTNAQGDAS